MNARKLTYLITGSVLLALPHLAQAESDEEALAACSEAFIQRLSDTFGPANYMFVPPRGNIWIQPCGVPERKH